MTRNATDNSLDSIRYAVHVRTSEQWRQFAAEVKASDDYTCLLCRTRKGPQRAHQLHVHHPEDAYDRLGIEQVDDCMTLCILCHREIHAMGREDRRIATLSMGISRQRARRQPPARRYPQQMRLPLAPVRWERRSRRPQAPGRRA